MTAPWTHRSTRRWERQVHTWGRSTAGPSVDCVIGSPRRRRHAGPGKWYAAGWALVGAALGAPAVVARHPLRRPGRGRRPPGPGRRTTPSAGPSPSPSPGSTRSSRSTPPPATWTPTRLIPGRLAADRTVRERGHRGRLPGRRAAVRQPGPVDRVRRRCWPPTPACSWSSRTSPSRRRCGPASAPRPSPNSNAPTPRLQQALDENAALHAQLLVQAREAGVADERRRLAAEIHDTIAQGLTGIIAQLQVVANAPDLDIARTHLGRASDLARAQPRRGPPLRAATWPRWRWRTTDCPKR